MYPEDIHGSVNTRSAINENGWDISLMKPPQLNLKPGQQLFLLVVEGAEREKETQELRRLIGHYELIVEHGKLQDIRIQESENIIADCSLLRLESASQLRMIDKLAISGNAAYALAGNELYYINKLKNICAPCKPDASVSLSKLSNALNLYNLPFNYSRKLGAKELRKLDAVMSYLVIHEKELDFEDSVRLYQQCKKLNSIFQPCHMASLSDHAKCMIEAIHQSRDQLLWGEAYQQAVITYTMSHIAQFTPHSSYLMSTVLPKQASPVPALDASVSLMGSRSPSPPSIPPTGTPTHSPRENWKDWLRRHLCTACVQEETIHRLMLNLSAL